MRNSVEARAKEVVRPRLSLSPAFESSFPSIRVQDDGEGMTEKDFTSGGGIWVHVEKREERRFVGVDRGRERASGDRDEEDECETLPSARTFSAILSTLLGTV